MTEESFKRKLNAILSADMACHNCLVSEDEAATIRTQETYRGGMALLIRPLN
jgi:hypothetical protein